MNEIETRAYPYFLKPVWHFRDGKLIICMIVIIVKNFCDATYYDLRKLNNPYLEPTPEIAHVLPGSQSSSVSNSIQNRAE